MKVRTEFVCNMPKDTPDAMLADLYPGVKPPIFVQAFRSWKRCGPNLIGPAYGENSIKDDVGVYHLAWQDREVD